MGVGFVVWPPLSLRRKDAFLDLPKWMFVVCRVEFGGPLTRIGQCIASDSTDNRRFALRGVNLASGRSAGGICPQGWVQAA